MRGERRGARRALAPLAAMLLWPAAGCDPRPTRAAGEEARPLVVLHGVRLRHYQGSELALVGHAASATYEREGGGVNAEGALLHFRGRAGAGWTKQGEGFRLTAPRLRVELDSRTARAAGGVVLSAPNGLVGRTSQLLYDARTQTVSGDERVALDGPGYYLDADGFLLLLAEERFEFEGDVRSGLGEDLE